MVGALDLVRLSFCPSHVSIHVGTEAGLSGRNLGRYVYQFVKLGWFLSSTSSGGLLPLLGVTSSGEPGLLVDEAPDPLFSNDVAAAGHLAQPRRSTIIKHVDISNALHLVPLKTSDVPSLGRWSASRHLLRALVTSTTERIFNDLDVIFLYFKGAFVRFGM